MSMVAAQFWQLIEASRREADGDPDRQIEVLRERLTELPESAILAFDRLFTEYWAQAYTWDLWGAAYLIGGGCSDDGFMDFRGWLVARGEAIYRAALADPDSLAERVTDADGDCQFEGFQYVASQAWEESTGRDSSECPQPTVAIPRDPSGEPWIEDELAERFPKLTARFG